MVLTPADALQERVARAIDPIAWVWIDKVRVEKPDHIALPYTLERQLAQAARAVVAAQATLCPFRRGGPPHGLEPTDPCPVCGSYGTFDAEDRCIGPLGG